ncbi:hypothetical protein ACVW02_002651 [Ewingella americana]
MKWTKFLVQAYLLTPGVVLDNSAMRIGALLLGFTRPTGTNTVADEIGKVVESTVKSLTSLFGSVLKRK